MNSAKVGLLALIAAVAVSAIWFTLDRDMSSEAPARQSLFPGLSDNLDALNQLKLTDASGNEVTLVRKDTGWTVQQKSKYAADMSDVGELILAVSDATIVEQKTANSQLYERIGVQSVEQESSKAVLLTLLATEQEYSVLLGNSSERFGGSTFVRKPSESASYLVSPKLSASTDANDWLDTQILNIDAKDIQSIKVSPKDSDVVEIAQQAMFDSSFDLVGREDDQTLNEATVRSFSGTLKGLEFERVLRGVAFPVFSYETFTVTYTLFSGVILDITLFQQKTTDEEEGAKPSPLGKYWLNVSARFDQNVAEQFVPQPTALEGDSAETQSQPALTLTAADLEDRRAEVEKINKTRKTWIYEITETQFNSMSPEITDLIQSNE